jgi:hypothetical protein
MLKSMKRAQRRQDIARLKRNRNNYWGFPSRWSARRDAPPVAPTSMTPAQLGKVVQYPQACSCAGCCNVRRAPNMNDGGQGWTRQETRHWYNYLEGLAELE